MVGAVVVVAVVASVSIYRQYAGERSATSVPATQTGKTVTATPRTIVPVEKVVPSSIDDISSVIVSETAADTAALDAEANGELAEIEADSESVNSLNESYDDNSF
jgi:hypothetical protein